MLTVFLYFVLLTLLSLCFFVAGIFILHAIGVREDKFYTQLFFGTLTGITLFTSISAIYFTHFKSIFTLLLLLLILLYIYYKLKKKVNAVAVPFWQMDCAAALGWVDIVGAELLSTITAPETLLVVAQVRLLVIPQ